MLKKSAATWVLLAVLICGCAKQERVEESAAELEATSPTVAVSSPKTTQTTPLSNFDSIEKALQAGEYDTAAAQLLGMRASGKQFSNEEAAQ